MSDTRLAFSYLAFSTAQQAEGRSSDRQHSAAEKWCQENHLQLAPSRQYCDEGVSRYNGRARMKGALSRFLKLCGTDKVPAGSVLIVEDFDRLSRENADDAWELFRGILLSDVEIVVLSLGRWFKKDSLKRFEDRLLVQACQHRAHSESAMKASRQRDIWADRRRRAAAGQGIHTNLPTWVCRSADGELRLIEDRAETVRIMVRWALDGLGARRIARRLTEGPEARPCWLERGEWDSESVQQILKRPAIWGAYQPQKLDDARQLVPAGELVRGHYPAVISEEDAGRVRRAMTRRRVERGRVSKNDRNVLRQIARCAETGGFLRLKRNHGSGKSKTLFMDRRYQGRAQSVIAYVTLEEVVLRAVQEWTPDALAEAGGDGSRQAAASAEWRAELARIDCDREAIRAELSRPGRAASTVAILAAQLDELDAREAEAKAGLEAEQSARPLAAALAASQSIIRTLGRLSEEKLPEARRRLNEHLRELLDGVWVYRKRWTVQTGEVIVQVWPRFGEAKVTRVLLGVPPVDYVPVDMTGVDFRRGYPAALEPAPRPRRKNIGA